MMKCRNLSIYIIICLLLILSANLYANDKKENEEVSTILGKLIYKKILKVSSNEKKADFAYDSKLSDFAYTWADYFSKEGNLKFEQAKEWLFYYNKPYFPHYYFGIVESIDLIFKDSDLDEQILNQLYVTNIGVGVSAGYNKTLKKVVWYVVILGSEKFIELSPNTDFVRKQGKSTIKWKYNKLKKRFAGKSNSDSSQTSMLIGSDFDINQNIFGGATPSKPDLFVTEPTGKVYRAKYQVENGWFISEIDFDNTGTYDIEITGSFDNENIRMVHFSVYVAITPPAAPSMPHSKNTYTIDDKELMSLQITGLLTLYRVLVDKPKVSLVSQLENVSKNYVDTKLNVDEIKSDIKEKYGIEITQLSGSTFKEIVRNLSNNKELISLLRSKEALDIGILPIPKENTVLLLQSQGILTIDQITITKSKLSIHGRAYKIITLIITIDSENKLQYNLKKDRDFNLAIDGDFDENTTVDLSYELDGQVKTYKEIKGLLY